MNVSLSRTLREYVRYKLESGMYSSASEVIREGLRLLQERDQRQQIRLEQLRREVELGWQQAQSGNLLDGARSMNQVMRRVECRRRKVRSR